MLLILTLVCLISQDNLIHKCIKLHDHSSNKQDAREAMRVVFSVLAKHICMHKTKFFKNIHVFKYCFKNYIQLMNLQIATQLIMMYNL